MSKRDFFGDPSEDDGPASKMRKMDDADDPGGSGRSGRVRKKSAKVLEMEEFEQAEKSTSTTKKTKTPKGPQLIGSEGDLSDLSGSIKKSKAGGYLSEVTPVSRKSKKNADVTPSFVDTPQPVPAELSLRVAPDMLAQMETIQQIPFQHEIKPELPVNPSSVLSSALSTSVVSQEIKQEDSKSVIKYLLSSPAAGSTQQITTGLLETPVAAPPTKKAGKKIKFEDKGASSSKTKEKKMKIEIMSPSEIGPAVTPGTVASESKGPGLKMKIMSGSNPMTAQVAMETQGNPDGQTPKPKKASKKSKASTPAAGEDLSLEIASPGQEDKTVKKKKVSKKKEKLIQDAISAAKQMPNLAALVASQTPTISDSTPIAQKPSKKKMKGSPAAVKKDADTSDSLVMDFDDAGMEDEGEESTLVIAETEKKKKKSASKKKSPKEKEDLDSPKAEKAKKIPKRAPTAYMLFCNAHRPAIVAENPGIEFAGISRKLGELWQTQSNKQKLQWRRKAQRRMKKSNLISTGKVGKESQSGPSMSVATAVVGQGSGSLTTTNQKLALMLQKSKPIAMDEGPLSPAKVGIDSEMEHENDSYNFSIEPLDVAAHLKLLGESLSIIGMRLQEHKGMIAVQGSLSVLLDSLLCACGPLLCLTQQVPGMDGCSPLVHAQTLDSVAYVMPGL